MSFDRFSFVVDGSKSEEYGEQVALVAKLLGRQYMQMHRIFTKEKWTLEEIKRTYQQSTKHNGNVSPQIAFWASRKRRNGVK